MKVQEYMLRAGVPAKFIGADLGNTSFINELKSDQAARFTKIYDIANSIVEDFEVGMLLEGIPGCGKSFLGCAMLREYIRKGHRSARTTSVEISDYYFDGFQGIRERYSEADVLFIDDVVKCGGTQANSTVIEKLIKIREDLGRITLYACNNDNQLKDKFSEEIFRLIKGTTVTVEFPPVDLRQNNIARYAKKFIS